MFLFLVNLSVCCAALRYSVCSLVPRTAADALLRSQRLRLCCIPTPMGALLHPAPNRAKIKRLGATTMQSVCLTFPFALRDVDSRTQWPPCSALQVGTKLVDIHLVISVVDVVLVMVLVLSRTYTYASNPTKLVLRQVAAQARFAPAAVQACRQMSTPAQVCEVLNIIVVVMPTCS